MLRSMTAFGRSSLVSPRGRYNLEIFSVNKKYLEVAVYIPSELQRFEFDLRKHLLNYIERGYVTIRIEVSYQSESPLSVEVNEPYVNSLIKAWQKIAAKVNAETERAQDLDLAVLSSYPEIFKSIVHFAGAEQYQLDLLTLLDEALKQFVAMKLNEGAQIYEDIVARLALLKGHCVLIKEQSGRLVPKFREKIQHKLTEALQQTVIEDERILREVFLYADKINIDEEITRLFSHISQVESLLSTQENAKAKRFEFLLQEMVREVNTIGSKAQDLAIANLVVDMKCALEAIREQIQNVE